MAYVGNVPARSFISFERQVFTIVNSQTAYTLSHSVTNENDIRLVVNNVVQEPGSGKAYTATGTTLTLSAALTNGTDEMYCVFLGRAVGTVNAPAGSVGTSQLAADAVTNAKIADDAISDEQLDPTVITGQTAETSIATDDLILLSDTSASGALKKMTRANFVSGVGGDMTPAFSAQRNSSSVTLNDNTFTDIIFDAEILDTDSAYNTSTGVFTVPSGKGGKYFIGINLMFADAQGNAFDWIGNLVINSSNNYVIRYQSTSQATTFTQVTNSWSLILDLSAGDALKVQGYVDTTNSSAGELIHQNFKTSFMGYKIIE